MDENIRVSVVVPMYNLEEYIDNSMECIVNQTLQEIEILCVDDGSTDATVAMVEEYARDDKRIRIIRNQKSNAGVARNLGLERAKGEYLLFLDGDDIFEPDLLEKMYEQIVRDHADICVCDADQYDTKQNVFCSKPQYMRRKLLPEQRPFSRTDIGKFILYFTTSVPWNKMVKREFVEKHQLHFQNIERANDQYFSIMALLLAENITVVDEVLVHYRINQEGNLTTEFSETPMCAYESMLAVQEQLDNLGLLQDEDVRCAFDNKILNLMFYSLNIQSTIGGYRQLYETLSQGGFETLGVIRQSEEYYFNKLEYENMCNVMKHSYDQFLLMKNREYRDIIAKKNAAYTELAEKKRVVTEKWRETEKKLKLIERKNWYKKITRLIAWYHRLIGKEDK